MGDPVLKKWFFAKTDKKMHMYLYECGIGFVRDTYRVYEFILCPKVEVHINTPSYYIWVHLNWLFLSKLDYLVNHKMALGSN